MTITCAACYRAAHTNGIPAWLTANQYGACHICGATTLCYDEATLTPEGQRTEALRRACVRMTQWRVHYVPRREWEG